MGITLLAGSKYSDELREIATEYAYLDENRQWTTEPLSEQNIPFVLGQQFHEMFCYHMLHDTDLRAHRYCVRYDDGSVEELVFVDPTIIRGQCCDARIEPLIYAVAS